MGTIESYWRELLLHICQPIYKLIVYLYELFEVVGTADIITGETLDTLYGRVGMLLGLYMMFRIILSFVQMLINPDNISDKEKGIGKITSKAILTILLLAITPFIFEKAFELQNYIVGVNNGENVIAKLVFPDKIVSSESFGPALSAYMFENFYRYDDMLPEGSSDRDCVALQEPSTDGGIAPHSNLYYSVIRSKGSISYARTCLVDYGDGATKYKATWNTADNEERYKISFTWNGVFAIMAGIVVCYTLLMYTIMVGARVIQLAFLRLISPMAILTFLSPKKDTMFEKWLKMCMTTYLDLFIRMAIIYFVVYIIDVIMGSGNGVALVDSYDNMWLVNIVMIVALLLFAKKAPELMKELFPKSGVASLGFGLKSPKKLFDDMLGGSSIYKAGKWTAKAATAGSALAIGGGLASGVSRFRANRHNGKGIGKSLLGGVGGFATALPRGIRAGAAKGNVFTNISKGFNEQRTIDDKYDQLITSGGSTLGKVRSTLTSYFGETKGQMYTRQLNNLDKVAGYKKDIQSYADEFSFVKSAKDSWEQMTQLDGEDIQSYEARKSAAFSRYKKLQAAVINASMVKGFNVNNMEIKGVTYTDYKRDASGNFIKKADGTFETEEVLIPDSYTQIDKDDKIYALDINAKQAEANSFIETHNVEYWDETSKGYKTMKTINDKTDLGNAADNAHITKTHILGPEESYHEAIANDKAAGVDSGATKNK